MFIRWKTKKSKDDVLHYVQMVKTSRNTGKPRQIVVKHLGSIRESNLYSREAITDFWIRVRFNLKSLDLTTEEEDTITKSVGAKFEMDR